jgi:oligopeptide/dipeptide ABC transporter ATP-binding protein
LHCPAISSNLDRERASETFQTDPEGRLRAREVDATRDARHSVPRWRAVTKLLEVRNLKTQFFTSAGVVRAVDGISYDVAPGETVAIVGESGCGKSVGAMSILRLIPDPPGRIVEGEIIFDGRDLLKLTEAGMRTVRGREIGMIFQEPMTSLNPVLSIERQLTETLEEHLGVSHDKAVARAIDLLGMVGISEPGRRLKQYPHHLSGGMRQRVMIAMALACEPKLIIADEPTTALDVTIQAQILELMKNLTRRLAVAMIIITHNLGVVARYADRVNVMYAGKIIESGDAEQIYHNPRHPYTLALLRSVPRMDQKRGLRLQPVGGQPPDLTKLDEGCSFRPRCGFAVERCAQAFPPLEEVEPGHHTACWERERVGLGVEAAE